MAGDFERQVSDFLGMWVGDIPEKTQYFDLDTIHVLRDRYKFPEDYAMVVVIVLEVGALGYWKETERSDANKKARRKDLRDLENASVKLMSVLDELPLETWQVLKEAKVARRFRHHPIDDVAEAVAQSVFTPQTPVVNRPSTEPVEEESIVRLRAELMAVAADAKKAQKWMGAGKPGRPDDDSAEALMQMCFMVWTEIIGREFTLAWHKNNADSDAARFCVDIAGFVDPKLSSSRIITASRKVREAGIGINSLDKLIAEADELSKRLN